ncbi:protein SINE3 [Euphorbia lathyris]|uniref:protein SINE3 n=1 Tax=Euphorbia lathyris TaxID=212925 RepID=UPI0033135715
MIENHTPQREDITSHRLKESRLKKIQKVPKRSLNAAFSTVIEEVSSETGKELTEFSPSSEASEFQSCVLSSSSHVSSEAFSDPNISNNSEDPIDVSMKHCIFHKLDGSVEVDIVSSFLHKARSQVLSSSDVDEQSKKLLDAVLKVVLDECYALPEERDFCAELVSARGRIPFLCIVLWSFIFSAILFFGLLSGSSYNGPLPT